MSGSDVTATGGWIYGSDAMETGGWICGRCGQHIPWRQMHVCYGREPEDIDDLPDERRFRVPHILRYGCGPEDINDLPYHPLIERPLIERDYYTLPDIGPSLEDRVAKLEMQIADLCKQLGIMPNE